VRPGGQVVTLSIRDQILQAETAAAAEEVYEFAQATYLNASQSTRNKWKRAVKAKRAAQERRLR